MENGKALVIARLDFSLVAGTLESGFRAALFSSIDGTITVPPNYHLFSTRL
jgi:hypothetical protein